MKKFLIGNPSLETKKCILEAMDQIRKGTPKSKIVENLKKKYDVGQQRAYEWVHDAALTIENANSITDIDAQTIKAQQIERTENILENAKNDKDRLKALEILNKLHNLYTEKQEITVTNDVIKFQFDS